jgi:hypothetical protein
VVHQNSLIADRPYRHEPHRRSTDRFTNRRRVSRIVLLPANVGLDIVGWHQPSVVPEFDQLAGPVVSRTAGLQAYDAGRQSSEQRQYVLASQGDGDHDPPIRVHHVNLEDVFRQIEANRRNRPQVNVCLTHLWRSFDEVFDGAVLTRLLGEQALRAPSTPSRELEGAGQALRDQPKDRRQVEYSVAQEIVPRGADHHFRSRG